MAWMTRMKSKVLVVHTSEMGDRDHDHEAEWRIWRDHYERN